MSRNILLNAWEKTRATQEVEMKFPRRGFLSAVAAVVIGMSAGLASAADRLNVVATTGMIADAARQVGQEHVEVRALMGAGVDPHAYRQTRSDIVALARADLVLWHGLYLEAQMQEFLLELGQDRAVVAVAETLPPESLIGHDDYSDKYDPHVWMDPDLWSGVVASVRDALSEADPENAQIYTANSEAHLKEIGALGSYSDEILSSVPPQSRVLLTAHDAFGYFGARYGFDVVGIQGISTESEAGLSRISELVGTLVDRDIKAVFVESSVSDRNIRALIEGASAKGHTVKIGGTLFSDAMGDEGTYEGTYIGMIDHNVTTIARSLGGDAPEGGMSDLLN